MHISIIFIGYQLIQLITLPCIGIYLLVRFFRKKKLGAPLERLGWVIAPPQNKPVIWLHAVSVGEVLALQNLVVHIKLQNPSAVCYVTVGTLSGKKMAQANVPADYISFLPFDFLPCMLLAYRRIKPQTLIVMEGDLWPNLLMIGRFKKIPLFLLNARVSARSEKNMFRASRIFGTLLNSFSLIFSQAKTDNQKFQQLGVHTHKLHVLGNLKAFNVIAKKEALEKKEPQEKSPVPFTILLAGSIHPGELLHYIELFKTLKPHHPTLRMILAPRHFGWQAQLSSALNSSGLSHIVWDEKNKSTPHQQSIQLALSEIFSHQDILAVCTLGKLFNLYRHANLFFLGGTFVTIGGHNLLEPAVWGVPMIVGPHHANCKEHADELEISGALIKVTNLQQLIEQTGALLENPTHLASMGKQAKLWLAVQAKAVKYNLTPLMKSITQAIINFEQQSK
jgi:3-deoxy-D-manno-octulosonic-acid transferase